jgi:hypothetical protein
MVCNAALDRRVARVLAFTELNFIHATYEIELDGEPADAIELRDGRVIVIDGENLVVFSDAESMLEPDDDEDDDDQLSLPLLIEE